MSDPTATASSKSFQPVAAVLAWLWPGLGHFSLGERKRGLLIMLGVLFLFVSGVLIGGFDAVDRERDRLWFLAQALCGPVAFGADFINQRHIKRLPEEEQLRTTSLGHVNEMGTLFAALAGLMNLVVILDVIHHESRKPTERRAGAEP